MFADRLIDGFLDKGKAEGHTALWNQAHSDELQHSQGRSLLGTSGSMLLMDEEMLCGFQTLRLARE